jgi:hypothetical protein
VESISETPPGVNPALVQALTAKVWERGARRLPGGEIRFACPEPELHANGDATPSARWNKGKAVWRCDVCGTGGGACDLAVRLGIEMPRETIYAVKDRGGTVVAEHVRTDRGDGAKSCTWRRDGRPSLGGVPVTALPLYGAERLATLTPGTRVVVCEGEKAASALVARGITAVGTVTGASTIPTEAVLRDLAGFVPVLWPDSDGPGREHMRQLARRLRGLGIACRVIDPWPDTDTGLDAADHIGDDAELQALLEQAAAPTLGTVGILISAVRPERVSWLWEPRLPYAKVALLLGRPDEGKTTLALDIAARVSTGAAMPFSTTTRTPAGVVVLSAEDSLGDTIRPRLEAAGADLDRIVAAVPEELPTLDEPGLAYIHGLVKRVDAKLVIVDPLAAFLPDHVDAHRDHSVRRLLRKLSLLAETTGASVLALRHPHKGSGGNAKEAGGGSIAFTAACRVELLAGADPEDDTRKILCRVKGNLAPPFPALAYRLVVSGFTVKVLWLCETSHSAEQLLAQPNDPEEQSALDEAKDAIRDILANGPVAAETAKEGLKNRDIAERTWKRAKTALRVRSEKESFSGNWTWFPPGQDPKGAKGAASDRGQNPGTLGNLGTLREDPGVVEECQTTEGCQDSMAGETRHPRPSSGDSPPEPPPPRRVRIRL